MEKNYTPISLPHPKRLLMIEPLDYPNPYDYHKEHRHDYFEVILVKEGQGRQRIDFSYHNMAPCHIFTIYPGQMHLMERNTANGLVIQFKKDVFEFMAPLQHHDLYFVQPDYKPDPRTFEHLYTITTRIKQILENPSPTRLTVYKAYSYLQILLITLTEHKGQNDFEPGHEVLAKFLSLLNENIATCKKVSEYCSFLNCSTDKLNRLCRAALGKTALQLIHEELLLEIRRLMLAGKMSFKEIAYTLNFDSPANFSAFIKAKTGLTPSQLQDNAATK